MEYICYNSVTDIYLDSFWEAENVSSKTTEEAKGQNL